MYYELLRPPTNLRPRRARRARRRPLESESSHVRPCVLSPVIAYGGVRFTGGTRPESMRTPSLLHVQTTHHIVSRSSHNFNCMVSIYSQVFAGDPVIPTVQSCELTLSTCLVQPAQYACGAKRGRGWSCAGTFQQSLGSATPSALAVTQRNTSSCCTVAYVPTQRHNGLALLPNDDSVDAEPQRPQYSYM